MKPLTRAQKEAIIETIKEPYIKAREEKRKEILDKFKFSKDQETYLNSLYTLVTVSDQIKDLERHFGNLRKEIENTFKDQPYYQGCYWYGNYATKEGIDTIKENVKNCTIDDKLNALISMPNDRIIERELELVSISKDFDIQSIIDKYTYTKNK